MYRRFLVAAIFLIVGACGGPEPAPGPAPLRVGTEPMYPPFESTDDQGEYEGFDMDLVRALGEYLGRPVEIRSLAFKSLIPELQAGRLDLVCSAMSRTEERAKTVDFSRPYVRVPMGVLLSSGRTQGVETLEDLDREDVVVAVQRGTTGESKARDAFSRARVQPYDHEVLAANEVAAGRADALLYDYLSVRKLHEKHPDTTRVLSADLGIEHYCMALPKGSPLKAAVDAFLEEAAVPGGTLDHLMATWLPDAETFRLKRE